MLLLAEENPENFWPLTQTRATFELRYGALCPLDRALLQSRDVGLLCREELAPYLRARTKLPVNQDISEDARRGATPFPGLPAPTPWDVLLQSDVHIAADFDDWAARHENYRAAAMLPGAYLVGDEKLIHVGEYSRVFPGCVLDASNGPIILGRDVSVKFSQIQGPAFIGDGCVLDGARVRGGTSLGPFCKIGGEISATIFQSRVNKAHDGFVGHSWCGRWVNFGALATTSNMKNTYGPIRYQRDATTIVDTDAQFLGSLIGDHTKIGIGQMLNTGSNIGVGCNVFGGGVAPKYVPSFSWGGLSGWQEYRLDDCLKTVRATLARRQVPLRAESEKLLRWAYEKTADERRLFLHRS